MDSFHHRFKDWDGDRESRKTGLGISGTLRTCDETGRPVGPVTGESVRPVRKQSVPPSGHVSTSIRSVVKGTVSVAASVTVRRRANLKSNVALRVLR